MLEIMSEGTGIYQDQVLHRVGSGSRMGITNSVDRNRAGDKFRPGGKQHHEEADPEGEGGRREGGHSSRDLEAGSRDGMGRRNGPGEVDSRRRVHGAEEIGTSRDRRSSRDVGSSHGIHRGKGHAGG